MSVGFFEKALAKTDEIEITVVGRKSGRNITHPVWFVQDGDKLYLLPVHGSETYWYKNVLVTPTIDVSVDGAEFQATAKPLTNPAEVRDVVDKFRAKYGDTAIERYYDTLDVAVEIPLE